MEIAEGRPNAEIGRQLQITEAAVKSRIGHLFTKLGTTNRVQLATIAYRAGLVD